MRTSALFGEKNSGFFEIYGVSHGQGGGGLSQCGQGESIFRKFWTAPYRTNAVIVSFVKKNVFYPAIFITLGFSQIQVCITAVALYYSNRQFEL